MILEHLNRLEWISHNKGCQLRIILSEFINVDIESIVLCIVAINHISNSFVNLVLIHVVCYQFLKLVLFLVGIHLSELTALVVVAVCHCINLLHCWFVWMVTAI